MKKISGQNTVSSSVLKSNDETIAEGKAVANLLAREFAGRGSSKALEFQQVVAQYDLNPAKYAHSSAQRFNKDFTIGELRCAMPSMKQSSPGPDNIPYVFISNYSLDQLDTLLKFYNYLWNTGLPNQWRYSHIFPIRKHSKPAHEVASYRPIALTNCLCKLFEK